MNYGALLTPAHPTAIELPRLRQECSKHFDYLDGIRTCAASVAPVHYREDYASSLSPWLECDDGLSAETPEYCLFDRMPIVVRAFKNRVGYEITSRRTGAWATVELVALDGVAASLSPSEKDLAFEVCVFPDRVRLWKYLRTANAPRLFRWKVTRYAPTKGAGDLIFREKPEAVSLADGKAVPVVVRAIPIDGASFYWEEEVPRAGVKVDTDIGPEISATANDGYVDGTSLYAVTNANWVGYSANLTKAYHMFYRWTGVSISGTVTASRIKVLSDDVQSSTGTAQMKVCGVDEDNPAAPTTYAEFNADPLTTAAADWDEAFGSLSTWYYSPQLTAIFQELVNSYTISNEAVMLQLRNDQSSVNAWNALDDVTDGLNRAAVLYVSYGTVSIPVNMAHRRAQEMS